MTGKYIVFEGIDNSGKSTISQLVQNWLRDTHRVDAILTRHPGSTPVGTEIRELLKHSPHPINANAQALLFAADHSLFVHQILLPRLAEGYWVLGDRSNSISSTAYQIASGCSFDELDKVHAATNLPPEAKLDRLFIFRCTWEVTQQRREAGGRPDRYEDAGKTYFDKLVNCYDSILEQQQERLLKFVKSLDRVHYIDATRPQQEVFNQISNVLLADLSE